VWDLPLRGARNIQNIGESGRLDAACIDALRAAFNWATFTADRRALLEKWAEFNEPKTADVLPMDAGNT
jgi:hypothetical protein